MFYCCPSFEIFDSCSSWRPVEVSSYFSKHVLLHRPFKCTLWSLSPQMFSMVCELFSFLKDMNYILMVLSRPGRWRWWDWCTPQPHNAPPNPSLSGMWGSSLRVMGLARLIIIGRLLLLTLVVLSNPEQPTTLFMLCVHPDRLSWKKTKTPTSAY